MSQQPAVIDGTPLYFKAETTLAQYGRAMKAFNTLTRALGRRDATVKEFQDFMLWAGYVSTEKPNYGKK